MNNKLFVIFTVILLTLGLPLFAQTTGGPDTFGYTWINSLDADGPDFNWITPSDDTTVITDSLTDDDYYGPVTIGFNFPFYTSVYSELFIGSNGAIFFGEGSNSTGNQEFPNPSVPNNIIALFWDDLHPGNEAGSLSYETITYEGQNAFLISYVDYSEFPVSDANLFTAQMILVEDGNIIFNYQSFDGEIDTAGSTVGIENSDGTDGLLYQYNDIGGGLENNLTVKFIRPPLPEHDLQLLSLEGNTTPSAESETIYTATIINNGPDESAYNVYLKDVDNNVLSTVNITDAIATYETTTVELAWTPTQEGTIQIFAEVELAGDVVPENNVSDTLTVNVMNADLTVVTVGDGTEHGNRIPMDLWYRDSITQSIYFPEEIGIALGTITSLEYHVQNIANDWTEDVDIYLGETDQTEFTNSVDSWVPYSNFTLVFSDNIVFTPGQDYTLPIVFDTPYLYSGGNLVVMVVKKNDAYDSSADHFYYTTTENHPNRTLEKHQDLNNEDFDPQNYPAPSSVMSAVPNTTFYMIPDDTIVNDLGLQRFSVPSLVQVGDEVPVELTVRNNGSNIPNNYNVDIYDVNDNLVHSQLFTTAIPTGTAADLTTSFTATSAIAGLQTLRAEVVLVGDELDINNTRYAEMFVQYVATTDIALNEPSLDLDGANNRIRVEDNDLLDFTDEDSYTLEAWVNFDSFGYYEGIISKYNSYNNSSYTLRLGGNSSSGYNQINFDGMESETGILELNKWTHISAVKDGAERHLYIDGVEYPLSGTAHTINANEDPLFIGCDYNYRRLDGQIDDVRIWNVARSLEDIEADSYQYLQGNEEGLVAYYPISLGYGDVAYSLANDLNGTIEGNANWQMVSPFANIGGPAITAVGNPTTVNVRAFNFGNTTSSYTIELSILGGASLTTYTVNETHPSSASKGYDISFVPLAGMEGDQVIVAEVSMVGDEVASNNNVELPIYINAEHDFEALSITGNPETAINNETFFTVSLFNHGMPENNFSVQLLSENDEVLTTANFNQLVENNEQVDVQVSWTPLLVDLIDTDYTVYAKVILPGDPITENDETAPFTFHINSEYDLEAVSLSSMGTVINGTPAPFIFRVWNNGVAMTNYTCYLKDTLGNVLATEEFIGIHNNSAYEDIQITWTPTSEGQQTVFAEVSSDLDPITDNNTTSNYTFMVQPEGFSELVLGDEENASTTNQFPIDLYYHDSISQFIIYADEIGLPSTTLTGLAFKKTFTQDNLDKPTAIWITETTAENLTDGFIPVDDTMTQVYDAPTDFMIEGDWQAFDFNAPFAYNGGNLLVTVWRYDTAYYSSNNMFYYSETNRPNRIRHIHQDNADYDLTNPPTGGILAASLPITQLYYEGDFGKIQGYVVGEDDNPISNVNVSLEGSSMISYTDGNGFYRINNVAVGTHNVVASKFGYYDAVNEGVVVSTGAISESNFTLNMLENVVVQGHVIMSDTQEGAPGASVTFSGYANYTTVTDDNGDFTIPNVYASQTYNVIIQFSGYQQYNGTVEIGTEDPTILPAFTVEEIAYPPTGLVATQNEEDTEVSLTWNAPVVPERELNLSSIDRKSMNSETRNTRVQVGYNIYRIPFGEEYDVNETNWVLVNDEVITDLSYTDLSWNDVESGVFRYGVKAVYTNGVLSTASISNWVAKNMYGSVTVNCTTNDGVDPEGAIIQLQATSPTPDGNYPAYTDTIQGGTVTITGVYKTSYNLIANYVGYEVLTTPVLVTDNTNTFDIMINEIRYIPWGAEVEINEEDTQAMVTWNPPVTPQRGLIGYNIYRLPFGEQTDPEETNWVLTNEAIVTDTTFVDASWNDVVQGSFLYAVKAVYTAEVESEATISNYVEKNMYAAVTINVTTNDGSSCDGANVFFNATLPAPNGTFYTYEAVVAEGMVTVPNVYKTAYNVLITFPNFANSTTPIVVENDSETFDIMITELLLPVNNAMASIVGADESVLVTWEAPGMGRIANLGSSKERKLAKQPINNSFVTNSSLTSERYVMNYEVYRFLNENAGNPSEWGEPIAITTELSYEDLTWADVPEGEVYRYAIKAIYTGDLASPAVITNYVSPGLFINIDIIVNSFYDNPIEGATVSLTGLTPDVEGNTFDYEVVTNAEGVAHFGALFKGNYDIAITKEGFVSKYLTNVPFLIPFTVTYQISEPLNPVIELTGEVNVRTVSLDWAAPAGISQYDFEDSEQGFTTEEGWSWGQSNVFEAHSGVNVWETFDPTSTDSTYSNNADWKLLSPEFSILSDTKVSFFINYDTEENADGLYCQITTNDGQTWQNLTPVDGYPSAADGTPAFSGQSNGWQYVEFEVGQFEGQTANFRWFFHSDSFNSDFYGVAIDDVRIGGEIIRNLTAKSMNTTAVRNTRNLLGYNIYRNGELLVENHPNTDFVETDVPTGDYVYGVAANYTTGEAEAVEISLRVNPVNITATVFGIDNITQGLEGVAVTFFNDERIYTTLSDADGNIEFIGVVGDNTYRAVFFKDGYQLQVLDEVELFQSDYNLGQIVLDESPEKVAFVDMETDDYGITNSLEWGGFVTNYDQMRYDDGVINGSLGTGTGENTIIGAVYKHNAIINQIEFYMSSAVAPHTQARVFIFALDENGLPALDHVIYQSELFDVVDDDWNVHNLPFALPATQGFFVGINTPNVYTGVGIDDGDVAPYVAPDSTFYSISDYTSPTASWVDIFTFGNEVNLAIRANGKDYGVLEEETTRNATREFTGYNVYRLLSSQQTQPNTWTPLAQNITEQTIVDTMWYTVPASQTYCYAVQRVYSSGVVSDPEFTEFITRDVVPLYDYTVEINNAYPESPITVRAENINGLSALVYEATLENTNSVTLTDIVPGIYHITYTQNNEVIFEEENFEITEDFTSYVANENDVNIPAVTSLNGNYPNPFNPVTTISFGLNKDSKVNIDIYNLKGQKVKTLVNSQMEAGNHKVTWNGTDDANKAVSSGIYFYKMRTSDYSQTKKMMLLK